MNEVDPRRVAYPSGHPENPYRRPSRLHRISPYGGCECPHCRPDLWPDDDTTEEKGTHP